ncbi:MAG TPA: ferritin-like domain-containing protein [Acidobacteriaceae bacterium]
MATLETQQLDAVIDNSRRKMIALGGTALAGLALVGIQKASAAAITDGDILNFALNLEYLEATYYNLALYGLTLDKLPSPVGINGTWIQGSVITKVSGGTATFPPVPFAYGWAQSLATEITIDETSHVNALRAALGGYGVAMPTLDLYNSFNALAVAAGLGASFDPFASDENFLIGGYIFEDVGVSAYHGAAGSITSKQLVLPTAVQIHAVEAYHAGILRTALSYLDQVNGNTNLAMMTQKISAARAALTATQPSTAPAMTPGDVGLTTTNVTLEGGSHPASTIVNADANSIAWSRTPAQVIAVVTDANTTGALSVPGTSNGTTYTYNNTGLFFPKGINGVIN